MTDSITEINTKITLMADMIQQARVSLNTTNKSFSFTSKDTRRIILLCLIFAISNDDSSCDLSLKDILTSLKLRKCVTFSKTITNKANSIVLGDTVSQFAKFRNHSEWNTLLIYAIEALEYNTDEYFSNEKKRGTRINNKKKNRGIYYTPLDVVSFMTRNCITRTIEHVKHPKVLDCSCGSGVFLLRCLEELDNLNNPEKDLSHSLSILEECIWGIDVSESAIDSCMLTMTKYYLETYEDSLDSFDLIWNTIKKCFTVGDATELGAILDNHPDFPDKFDCIIGNPPYISKDNESNLFIDFVYNLINFSSNIGCSSLIVPLSICYSNNKPFIKLREELQANKAKLEFINFDRSPDSLFGDQVKTRNTIIIRDSNFDGTKVYTSGLIRWSSENRNELFNNIQLCDISDISIIKGIPKFSSTDEKVLFTTLECKRESLHNSFSKSKHKENIIVLNGTAYNWLCVYDHIPPSVDENGDSYISSSTKILSATSSQDKYFVIALLSNRIAYWYWITKGDGFHVNSSFIKNYNIGKSSFTNEQYNELCRLGLAYSKRVKQHPTQSRNAGKILINYSHLEALDIVEQIESIILSAMDLQKHIGETLVKWYDNQVRCNRNK